MIDMCIYPKKPLKYSLYSCLEIFRERNTYIADKHYQFGKEIMINY
jgi:hypothetical protein